MDSNILRNYHWGEAEGLEVYALGTLEAYDAFLLKVGPCVVIYYSEQCPSETEIVQLLPFTPDRLFFKKRFKQCSLQQYQQQKEHSFGFWVREYDLRFWVDPGMYHDIGLFIDQRLARQWLRNIAHDKKVLNLFAYTGSLSVVCGKAGACSVTSIDLLETYLSWAQKNWAANNLEQVRGKWLRRDVLEWIRSLPFERFDIIIVDPPSFSQSKKMRQVWNVQKDHEWFLQQCYKILQPNGIIYFSTHAKDFQFSEAFSREGRWREVSQEMRPFDFPASDLRAFIYRG